MMRIEVCWFAPGGIDKSPYLRALFRGDLLEIYLVPAGIKLSLS